MVAMQGRDIWLRHTDKNGNSHVQHHRVWDRDKFLATQQADAAREGGKVEETTEPPREPRKQ